MNDKLKHKIINYLNKEYSGLVRYETDQFPDYIFFMKNGKVIYQYNKKNGWVFISYKHIWSFLKSFFGLEHEEIKHLTKEWVEEQLKMEVTATLKPYSLHTKVVEEQLKMEVTATTHELTLAWNQVEEQLKMEVTQTCATFGSGSIQVEEQFKMETNEQ